MVPARDVKLGHVPTGGARTRRRGVTARIGRRGVGLLFLFLGVTSVLGLTAAVARTARVGAISTRGGLVLLGSLTLMAGVVVSQGLAYSRAIPGISRLWIRAARRRARREAYSGPALLARDDGRATIAALKAKPTLIDLTSIGRDARRFGATTGWVALTILIMGFALLGVAAVSRAAVSSWSGGVSSGTLWMTGFAGIVTYAVGMMCVALVRSWFERRRRRLRRMLSRLLRNLLRWWGGIRREMTRMLGRRSAWPAGSLPLSATAAALIVTLGVAVPISGGAGGGSEPPGEGDSALPAGGSQEGYATGESAAGTTAAPAAGGSVSPTPETTSTTAAVMTSNPVTTTTSAPSTTTTVKTTTTTVKTSTTSAPSTTTTAPVPADEAGPSVTAASDWPDPVFTSGSPPDASSISATVSDPSGVASAVIWYREGAAKFAVWGPMIDGGGGSYSAGFGPFATAGVYEYRIVAVDGLGNANCSIQKPASCPGGTVTVVIP